MKRFSVGRSLGLCFTVLFLSIFFVSLANALRDGNQIPFDDGVMVPNSCSGDPACHVSAVGSTFNQVGELTLDGLPGAFVPGQTYELTATRTPGVVWGFQVAAVYADDTQAGSLEPVTAELIHKVDQGIEFLVHSPQPLPSGTTVFRWTAPMNPQGPVTLRLASNAANDDHTPGGDHIRTLQQTISPTQVPDGEVFYFPQVADAVLGPVVFDTTLVFVNTGDATEVMIEFFDSAGDPMVLELGGLGSDSEFEIPMARGASFSAKTPGTEAGARVGYARVTAGPGVGGTAIFSESDGELQIIFSEAGVPASLPLTEFSLFVDSPTNTGVAMVNTSNSSTANLTVSFYDTDFNLRGSTNLQMPERSHRASFVFELIQDLPDIQGSLVVTSDQELAVVTLLAKREPGLEFPETVPTLTTFPVVPGSAAP